MVPPTPASEESSAATFAGLPRWLAFSLLTIISWGAWGAVSKVASDGVDANTNQIFFTLGLNLAPWLFGLLLDQSGANVIWLSGSLGMMAFAALLVLPQPKAPET